jgi:hypothetical protein
MTTRKPDSLLITQYSLGLLLPNDSHRGSTLHTLLSVMNIVQLKSINHRARFIDVEFLYSMNKFLHFPLYSHLYMFILLTNVRKSETSKKFAIFTF